jgi:hypothetical protein
MKNLAIIVITLLLPLSSLAQELQTLKQEAIPTNINGLVVKDLKCRMIDGKLYEGTVSNRTNTAKAGHLYIYSYDKAGDGIGQCHAWFSLDPRRGTGIKTSQFEHCNCAKATSVELVVEAP